MLNQSQIKKLNFLNEKLRDCQKCKNLFNNGKAYPYYTRHSKYLMLAEAPGGEEVHEDYQTPLVGRSGIKMFTELSRHKLKFKRKDFMILNTVQCRPVIGTTNGKPSNKEIETCRFWTSKYIEIFEPEIILALGNYANKYFFDDDRLGITRESGIIRTLDNGIKVMPCIHPASLLYSSDNLSIFRSTLKAFRKEVDLLKK